MRGGGVEPPPRKPGPAPQTDASTNSAILAQAQKKILISKSCKRCEEGGSNPHPVNQDQPLKLARLPIPPSSHVSTHPKPILAPERGALYALFQWLSTPFLFFLQKKPFVVYIDANSGACAPIACFGRTCANCSLWAHMRPLPSWGSCTICLRER